jgi:chitinase
MKKLKFLFCLLTVFTSAFSCKNESASVVKSNAMTPQIKTQSLQTVTEDKVVVGYIKGGGNVQSVMNSTDLNIVTHINLAFFKPNSSGTMMSGGQPVCSDLSAADITYVVNAAHQKGRKVLASIGGASARSCSGDIAVLFRAANRTNFINNLASLATYFNLDGIDIDVEGTTLETIVNESNYAPFIAALRTKINPLGKLVTAATAGYEGGMIPSSSYPYLDLVNIMSYDIGWGGTANHSTYDDALTQIQRFLDDNCPASKLVLGVPFYGYKPTVGTGDISFKSLIAQYGANAAYVDYYDGYKYNGITAIEAKTKYAAQHIRGVMIWELSQDATGTYSLVKAIGRKIGTPSI